MKKIFISLLVVFSLCLISGCGNTEEREEYKKDDEYKNYDAITDSYYDCGFEKIDDIIYEADIIVANSKLYILSSKKNSETDNHCRPFYKNENNYKYLGHVRTYEDGQCALYLNNSGKIIAIDESGKETRYKYKKYVDVEKLYSEKKFNYFRYTNTTDLFQTPYFYYFTDDTLYYQIDDLGNEISLPSDEDILYFGIHDPDWKNTQSKDIFMLITNKHKYTVGVAKNAKCMEYEDVECSYTLNITTMYDTVFRDFNIKYFDGKRLITKDNVLYHIRQYYIY